MRLLACLTTTFLMLALPAAARAGEGIAEVLQRSQLQRLAMRPAADEKSDEAERVRASFERLRAMDPQAADIELVLVGGPLYAEAIFASRKLAVSTAAGQLPEGERSLLIAHEMGHLRLGHWGLLSALYRRHIPGEVRPETTEPVARALAADAQQLSHRQEFEADGYGYEIVRKLGFGLDNAFGLLTRQGLQFDSPTHPGTRRRLAALRALDGKINFAIRAPGEGEALAATPAIAEPAR